MSPTDFPYRSADGMDKPMKDYLAGLKGFITAQTTPLTAIDNIASGGEAADSASDVTSSAITPVDATAATNATPFGYSTQDQADAIVAAINFVIARQALIITAVNALVSDMGSNAALIESNHSASVAKINEILAAMRAQGKMET